MEIALAASISIFSGIVTSIINKYVIHQQLCKTQTQSTEDEIVTDISSETTAISFCNQISN